MEEIAIGGAGNVNGAGGDNSVRIKRTAALAPMASVADGVYRRLCKSFGCAYVVSEMVSAKGLCYSERKTGELCTVTQAERPMAIQLFGEDAEYMGMAAEKLMRFSPDIIDINMGCPVPKVVSNGAGSALMKTPEKAFDIVRAVCSSCDCPVTVKIRSGWDETCINAAEMAMGLEASGAAAIAVHGRTRDQFYSGQADWDIIKKVKQSVSCPVIGNGDVRSAEDCLKMYEYTGCDLVMIGRASYGRPWIFQQVEALLLRGQKLPEPPLEKRMEIMLLHARQLCGVMGEERGMREARKHVIWYVKGLPNSACLRRRCSELTRLCDLECIAEEIAVRGEQSSRERIEH